MPLTSRIEGVNPRSHKNNFGQQKSKQIHIDTSKPKDGWIRDIGESSEDLFANDLIDEPEEKYKRTRQYAPKFKPQGLFTP